MKEGVFLRSLILGTALLSSTVLAQLSPLFTSEMSLLHSSLSLALFLLPLQTAHAASTNKIKMDDCTSDMVCLVPRDCMLRGEINLLDANTVYDDCQAIAKFRAYSDKYWLVALESFDPTVNNISLKHGTENLISCSNGFSSNLAQYKTSTISPLIEQKSSPLLCKFKIEQTSPIFTPTDLDVVLTTENGLSSTLYDSMFGLYVTPKCDPKNINPRRLGLVGDRIVVSVNGDFSTLGCPSGYSLEYEFTSGFATVSKIVCNSTKKNPKKFEYIVNPGEANEQRENSKFFARCSALACSLCDLPPVASGTAPTVKTRDDGCKILECPKNWIQIDSGVPKTGAAQCVSNNDNHVWELDGEQINGTTLVTCMEEIPCDSTAMCARAPDGNKCATNAQGFPECSGQSSLSYGSMPLVGLRCNNFTGDFEFTDNGLEVVLASDAVLSCTSEAVEEKKESSAGVLKFALIGVGVLLVIGLVILCFCLILRRKKKADASKRPTAASSKKTTVKSLEPKSKTETVAASTKAVPPAAPAAAPKAAAAVPVAAAAAAPVAAAVPAAPAATVPAAAPAPAVPAAAAAVPPAAPAAAAAPVKAPTAAPAGGDKAGDKAAAGKGGGGAGGGGGASMATGQEQQWAPEDEPAGNNSDIFGLGINPLLPEEQDRRMKREFLLSDLPPRPEPEGPEINDTTLGIGNTEVFGETGGQAETTGKAPSVVEKK